MHRSVRRLGAGWGGLGEYGCLGGGVGMRTWLRGKVGQVVEQAPEAAVGVPTSSRTILACKLRGVGLGLGVHMPT